MINRHPVIVAALLLGMFAVIGTSLVAFTYENTFERIAENERQALLKKLYKLIPPESINNDIVNDTVTVSDHLRLGAEKSVVYLGRYDDKPVAAVFVTVAPEGYSGTIKLLVAVKTDGSLGGVRIVSHRETPGLGDKVEEEKSDWILQFAGKSLLEPQLSNWKVKRDGGYFDQFTGATITPRTIVKAVKNTLLYYRDHGDKLFSKQPQSLPIKASQEDKAS